MILTHENDVESSAEDLGHDFGIDEASMGILFKGFSDNLYSNKIGSIVREIASNCFDAHAELGTNQDVHITLKGPDVFLEEPGKISFRDFGVGLSPDRVKSIYSKYFASTKRDTNGQIGGFGIGAKSPLAYSDIFEVITNVDGKKYHYMIHKGVNVPRIDLVSTEETNDPRGTEVIIPIKNSKDYDKFVAEIKSQLKYFDGIKYFGADIENDYKILKAKTFIVSSNDLKSTSRTVGICIGKVGYPMNIPLVFPDNSNDYEYRTPISLYFEIGELSVTMNRESIEYTEDAIKLIAERYEEAKAEAVDLKTKFLDTETNLVSYIESATQGSYIPFKALDNEIVRFPSNFGLNDVKTWNIPEFKDFKFIAPYKNLFDQFMKISHYYDGSVVNKKKKVLDRLNMFDVFKDTFTDNPKYTIYRSKESVNQKKLEYLKSICPTKTFVIVKLDKLSVEDMYDSSLVPHNRSSNRAVHYFNLSDADEEAFNNELKIYSNYVMKFFIKNSLSYDKIEIDADWEKDWKENKVYKKVDKTEITLRKTHAGHSYHKYTVKADRLTKEYHKDALIVYAFQGEEREHYNVIQQLNNAGFSDNAEYFKVSRDNARRYIKPTFPNAYHVDEIKDFKRLQRNILRRNAVQHVQSYVQSLSAFNVLESYHQVNSIRTTKNVQEAIWAIQSLHSTTYKSGKILSYSETGLNDVGNMTYDIHHNYSGISLMDLATKLEQYALDNPLLFKLIDNVSFEVGTEEHTFFNKALLQNFKPFNINL